MEELNAGRLTSIRLDVETYLLLTELARDVEGNRSLAMRRAIRADAAQRGVLLQPAQPSPTPEGRQLEVCP